MKAETGKWYYDCTPLYIVFNHFSCLIKLVKAKTSSCLCCSNIFRKKGAKRGDKTWICKRIILEVWLNRYFSDGKVSWKIVNIASSIKQEFESMHCVRDLNPWTSNKWIIWGQINIKRSHHFWNIFVIHS